MKHIKRYITPIVHVAKVKPKAESADFVDVEWRKKRFLNKMLFLKFPSIQ
ncbi:hypothetical protein [Viridibacillus arvi]|nr:hypothetical protein [Viridibacillus arvi]